MVVAGGWGRRRGLDEPRALVAVGVAGLLLSLVLAGVSLKPVYKETVSTAILSPGDAGVVARIFSVPSGSIVNATLVVESRYTGPVEVGLLGGGSPRSYTVVLMPGDEAVVELWSLLSTLYVKPLSNETGGVGVFTLRVACIEKPLAPLSLVAFTVFLASTMALSIGVVGYWLERPVEEAGRGGR